MLRCGSIACGVFYCVVLYSALLGCIALLCSTILCYVRVVSYKLRCCIVLLQGAVVCGMVLNCLLHWTITALICNVHDALQ